MSGYLRVKEAGLSIGLVPVHYMAATQENKAILIPWSSSWKVSYFLASFLSFIIWGTYNEITKTFHSSTTCLSFQVRCVMSILNVCWSLAIQITSNFRSFKSITNNTITLPDCPSSTHTCTCVCTHTHCNSLEQNNMQQRRRSKWTALLRPCTSRELAVPSAAASRHACD